MNPVGGFGDIALSLAMLAAFALLVGGGWLAVKRRDLKRALLMMSVGVVLIVNILIWLLPMSAG